MRNQIEALYAIVRYLEEKCPDAGRFWYGIIPHIQLRGIEEEMATQVLQPHIESLAKPANLTVSVQVDAASDPPSTYVYVESALLMWDSVFPYRNNVPTMSPLEWLIEKLQEQLFPRTTGFSLDIT